MKYARIVRLFAERVHLSYEDALGFFYDSETYGLINDGVGFLSRTLLGWMRRISWQVETVVSVLV